MKKFHPYIKDLHSPQKSIVSATHIFLSKNWKTITSDDDSGQTPIQFRKLEKGAGFKYSVQDMYGRKWRYAVSSTL